jgi:hypothetical protein
MAKLIGNAPNQIPTNADLGSMAFEDKKNYATTSSPIYQPYRNIVINGDMSIAQRGTSFAGITTSNYMVDRFTQSINGTFGTWTNGQETDAPANTGFQKSLFMNCTTADAAPAAADFVRVSQRFEGQMLQYLKKGTSSAESLTLSFWVKSPKTGTHIAELEDRDNTRYVSQSYTINAANTWEKKTLTFAGDTTGAFGNDNDRSLDLNFYLGVGATWSSGTLGTTWHTSNANRAAGQVNVGDAIHSSGNYWQITGVQLEAGTSASDFEFLPVDVNLNRCFRYFYKFGPDTHEFFGYGYATNNAILNINLPTSMRTAPSFTTSGTYVAHNGTNATSTPSFTTNTVTTIMLSPAASMTVTQTHPCRVFSNTSGVFSISAEL